MINFLKRIAFFSIYNLKRFVIEIFKSTLSINKNDLFSKGFAKFHTSKSKELSFYLDEIIKNPETAESSKLGYFRIVNQNEFGIKTLAVDTSSKFLHEYVFTDEILSHIEGFFGNNFYLRNNPTIEYNYNGEKGNVQMFHVDGGLRQLSVMINLTDLKNENTHMEYLVNTNHQYFLYKDPDRLDEKEKEKIKKLSDKNPLERTIGDKGTVSIFNAGNGYHRQVGGGVRTILHLNFVDNLLHTSWSKNWKPSVKKFSSEKKANAYYFSWLQKDIDNKNEFTAYPNIFSLVNRNLKKSLFNPNIYTNK